MSYDAQGNWIQDEPSPPPATVLPTGPGSAFGQLSPQEQHIAAQKQAFTDNPASFAQAQQKAEAAKLSPTQALVAGQPDTRGSQPEYHPGADPNFDFKDQFGDEVERRAESTAKMFRYGQPAGAKGPAGTAVNEYENANTIGGPEEFKGTFKEGPKKIGDLQRDIGKLESQSHESLAKEYENQAQKDAIQSAKIASRKADDDQQLLMKQRDLDEKTVMYTNDLANQNKFWQNPGNIVSAIAYSLMSVFSSDPAIGAKLINQAVDRDMNNRKDLANMHLGELRSNIGTYRKFAEDRQAGDLLAQSEAHRIAANQIRAIGERLASPIALKNAELAAQDQETKSAAIRAQAYNHYLYNRPQVMDPRLAAFAKQKQTEIPEGWTHYDLPKSTVGAVKSVVSGGAGPSTAAGTPVPGQEPISKRLASMPATTHTALVMSPGEVAKQGLDSSLSKGDMAQMAGDVITARARALAGDPAAPGYQAKVNEHVDKMQKSADAGVGDIAKNAMPFQVGLVVTNRLQRDMNIIKNELKASGVDPNEFLGELRTLTGGPLAARINDLRLRYGNASGAGEEAQKRMLAASERFHQALNGKIVGYYHDMAGAAQNAAETGNLKQVINNSARWDQIEQFIGQESMNYSAQMKSAIRTAPDPYSAILYMSMYGNGDQSMLIDPGLARPTVRQGTSTRGTATLPVKPVPGAVPSNAETDMWNRHYGK